MATYIRTIELKTLSTIKEILAMELDFLSYSTQTRNVAQLIQLERMLSQIHFDRGLGNMYHFNLLRIRSDILKGLLYCSLREIGIQVDGKRDGIMSYCKKAKKKGLISKSSCIKIEKIAEKRNDFHPNRQKELYVQVDQETLKISNVIIAETLSDLRKNVPTALLFS